MRTLVLHGDPATAEVPPVLVTPAADHWMGNLTFSVGRQLWRDEQATPIASTYLGIVTTRAMAECLGWPEREIGFEDVIRLGVQPGSWRSYPCARPEWGDDAQLGFTYPDRSSTARSLL
jgi:Ca-activated chloride channel family protein